MGPLPAHPRSRAPRRGEQQAGAAVNGLTGRELLRTSLVSGAGLFVAFHIPRKALAAGPKAGAPRDPNAFVRVAPDESVTVLLAHSEMGQGIWTGLSMMIAEELDCDSSRIRVEHGPAAPVYAHTAFGFQMTGGSSTTWSEFERYRTVGAMAREMLVRAAAARWKTSPKKLRTEHGFVLDRGRKLSYGELALAAQALPPPASVKLKDKKDWKLLGKPTRRLDTPEKINGKALFGMDVHFPDLRTALVARAPVFGDLVKSFAASGARALEAEHDVPSLAHARMEPLNCTVKLEAGRCEIWTGTQFQTGDQGAAAQIAGVPPQNVSIHTPFLGGGFGRRANPSADFVSEAVHVAKAAGVPVKVVWTREDDIRGGYYRPLFLHRIEVGVDAKGLPVAWRHGIVGQSILAGTPFEAFLVKDGLDGTSVEGVPDSPYPPTLPARRRPPPPPHPPA